MAVFRALARNRPCWPTVVVAAFLAIATMVAPTHAPPSDSPRVDLSTSQFGLAPLPAQPALDAGSAVAVAGPSIVRLDTGVEYQGISGNGAGILLDPNGVVLTNYHVVQGADHISGTQVTSGRSFRGQLIGYDRRTDIAVVQLLGASGLPVAQIGDSGQVAIGEPIVTIGNAGGGPQSTSPGTVTALGQSIVADDTLTGASEELSNLIEVAADVRAGDSGGALVNSRGQVIGVVVAASVNYRVGTPGGKGFAIPINDAMAVANQIRSRTPSDSVHIGPPAMLGVGVSTAAAAPGGIPGVLVRDVLPGTPAEAAGLAPGDVIVSINGAPIDSANALTFVLDRHYPGDNVDVTWVNRSGQSQTAKVTLMPGPDG